ncbi:hypothetical protein ACWKWO_16075, partial [Schumannella luteola]
AETQVLGARRPSTGPVPEAPASAALATTAASRRKRGWWIFGSVAALAVLAALLGWCFGAGPGSRVTQPEDLAGMSAEQATEALSCLRVGHSRTLGLCADFRGEARRGRYEGRVE